MMHPARQHAFVPDVEAVPSALLDTPLEYFAAENSRRRQLCRALSDLAMANAPPPASLRAVAGIIRSDLALRTEDDERDLFDLLRSRAEDNELERAFGILSADHAGDRAMAMALCEALEAAAMAAPRHPGLADLIGRFVSHRMRHVALEQAVVLPIARLRLTAGDLQALAAGLKARRVSSIGP